MRSLLVVLLLLIQLLVVPVAVAYAEDDDGVIDFFKVFSKDDENVDRIGSQIYNWSIYLPGAAEIDKNPKPSDFHMFISGFKTDVYVQVLKNVNKLSTEELYALEWEFDNDYAKNSEASSHRRSAGISTDKNNNKFVVISYVIPEREEYENSIDEEQTGIYSERRVYTGRKNNADYIYVTDVDMDLEFYQKHKDLFYKIADSFKTAFDDQNPNLRDLSGQITKYRNYRNQVFGWEIEIPPYWKSQGSDNSFRQSFAPLYSDQEIGNNAIDSRAEKDSDKGLSEESLQNGTRDSLSVFIVSSIPPNEDFDKWAKKEIDLKQLSYCESLYKQIVSPHSVDIPGTKGMMLLSRIKNSSQEPTIEGLMLLQGSQYRYKVVLRMNEPKYNQKEGKEAFDRILKSFRLIKGKSKFAGDFLAPESVLNLDGSRVVSMEKYSLKTVVNNSWMDSDGIWKGLLDEGNAPNEGGEDPFDSSNKEEIVFADARSGSEVDIMAALTPEPIDQIIQKVMGKMVSAESENASGISGVTIWKAKVSDETVVYRFVNKFNVDKMEQMSKKDGNKTFNYASLCDEYTYMFKKGQEFYIVGFTIPIVSTSRSNLKAVEQIWQHIVVDNVPIGAATTKWEKVNRKKGLLSLF